jgi:polyisoprenoid-binding protein YceI
MKTIITIVIFLVTITGIQAQTQKYLADIRQSDIIWTGKKVTGEHTGTLKVKSGNFTVENGMITKGEFIVDMTSLICTDIKDAGTNASLVGHLKSPDFFDVEQYPEARLEILSSAKADGIFYEAKASLTIKGITLPYTFKYAFKDENGVFAAMSTMQIDRSKYNVQYGSESFFKNLGDKVIYDNFDLQVKVIGKLL